MLIGVGLHRGHARADACRGAAWRHWWPVGSRGGDGSCALRLRRLADGELRERRDARSAPRSAARPVDRRDRRDRALSRGDVRLPARARRGRTGADADAGVEVHAAGAGRSRRAADRARHRGLDRWISQPEHAHRAAGRTSRWRATACSSRRSASSIRARACRSWRSCCKACGRRSSRSPGKYDQILNYVEAIDVLFFGLTGASLLIFRARESRARPRRPPADGMRVPGHPVTTMVFVLACWAISAIDDRPVSRRTRGSAWSFYWLALPSIGSGFGAGAGPHKEV